MALIKVMCLCYHESLWMKPQLDDILKH